MNECTLGVHIYVQGEGGNSPVVVTNQNDHNSGEEMETLFQLIHNKYACAGGTHDELSTVDNT